MSGEKLLAAARKHIWAAWLLSSEELASQAAEALLQVGMLVPEGSAQELEKLKARVAQLEAALAESEKQRAAHFTEAARLLEDTGRDDDAVNLLDNVAAGIRVHAEGEHYAAVHHTYRVPRDLPEMGATS